MSRAGYPASQSAGTFRRDTATKRRHDATSQHPLARNIAFSYYVAVLVIAFILMFSITEARPQHAEA